MMRKQLLIAQKGQQGRRKSPRVTALLVCIVGLLMFYSLAGCSSGGKTANTLPSSGVSSPTTPTGRSPTAVRPSSPWTLVWSDEFDGPAGAPPDPHKWRPQVGGAGWGNRQMEYDTSNQNAYQDGQGNLVIEARSTHPDGLQCWYGTCQYTSARITTAGLFHFTYGRIEARIKIPAGMGLWPTFWLLGSDVDTVGWPGSGEVDIMENIGRQPDLVYGVVHGPGPTYFGTSKLPQGIFADAFHTYALEWNSTQLSFFVDGQRFETVYKFNYANQQDWVYNHPFDIILNLAVGGSWPGSPDHTTTFPAKMDVSYVRVYKPR